MNKTIEVTTMTAAVILICFNAFGDDGPTRELIENDRFRISKVGSLLVLLHSETGQTWRLRHVDGPAENVAWLPIERIDDPESAREWHVMCTGNRVTSHSKETLLRQKRQLQRVLQEQEEKLTNLQEELQGIVPDVQATGEVRKRASEIQCIRAEVTAVALRLQYIREHAP